MKRSDVFEKRQLVGASVQLAANCIQNDPKDLTWKQVENMRKDLQDARKLVDSFISDVETVLTEGCDNWKDQWDLTFQLHEPYNEPYDPTLIDIEALAKEFEEKGLNEELALILATSIAKPEETGL